MASARQPRKLDHRVFSIPFSLAFGNRMPGTRSLQSVRRDGRHPRSHKASASSRKLSGTSRNASRDPQRAEPRSVGLRFADEIQKHRHWPRLFH